MVFVTSFISGCKKILVVRPAPARSAALYGKLDCLGYVTCQDIINIIIQKEGCSNVCLSCEGKPIQLEDEFKGDINIVATLRLRGGKGGFGSMLRAIGAQIEKTTNREACRDLSGRRLRDINEEKRLKEYLAQKVEKEKEMLNQKKKKLEQLKEGPKHIFEDKTYFEQREKRERDIHDSLDKAFASSSGRSQLLEEKNGGKFQNPLKRKRMTDNLDDSSSEESNSEEEASATRGEGKREGVAVDGSLKEEDGEEQQRVTISGTNKDAKENMDERKTKSPRIG